MTPVYSLAYETPWLFYYEQTNDEPTSFYYKHSQGEINTICDNIADLAEKLDEKYNMKMVFMPIPSKYTVYHDLLNNDEYNDFLPLLYKGLKERSITVINLYDEYINSDEILYYGTDTHWNRKGLDIAVNKTIKVIDSIQCKENYIADKKNSKKKSIIHKI